MKKISTKFLIPFLVVIFGGCASIEIPHYIQDNAPYRKKFYASYESIARATTATLEEMGWEIVKTTNPAVYERISSDDETNIKQVLLFTNVRHTSMFIATRYSRINIYIRSIAENETEVEVRYLAVTSIPFKSFYSYKKDKFAKSILKSIEAKLQ